MSENNKTEESIKFVAHYYEDGALLPRQGWHRFMLTHKMPSFLRRNVAAACIAAVVLAASASIYYISNSGESYDKGATEVIATPADTRNYEPEKVVRIQFSDASLKEVVAEIEKTYGVKICNIPEEDIRLTISYEGNAFDVVETINELLDTKLKIEANAEGEEKR